MATCKRDSMFKNVFYDRPQLSELQKSVKSITGEDIKITDYSNNELANDDNKVKSKRLDFVVKTNDGLLNIEVNSTKEFYSHERNMAYVCNLYNSYVKVGEKKYDKNFQIRQINLSYGLGTSFGIRKYTIKNGYTNYVNNITIYEVSMDYFKKIWYSQDVERIKKYKYIIMLDLEKDELQKLYEITNDMEVKRFMDRVMELDSDGKFYKYVQTEEDIEEDKLQAYNDGKTEGKAEGKIEGLNESKLDIARNLLKMKMSIENISKATGLSEKKIKSL